MDKAIQSILDERVRQNEKWGKQSHRLPMWCCILTEEVGEFSQAIVKYKYEGGKWEDIRKELIHVAAVALQIIEALDECDLSLYED